MIHKKNRKKKFPTARVINFIFGLTRLTGNRLLFGVASVAADSFLVGSPLHRENRENGQTNNQAGKTQGICSFGKTQEVLFAQVVNSLLLRDRIF